MVVPGRVFISTGNKHMVVSGKSSFMQSKYSGTEPLTAQAFVDVNFRSVAAQ
jgi:chemotaxis response regulator CheB